MAKAKKKAPGRPVGSANTTGWARVTIALRPAVATELARQARAAGLSKSRFVANLIEGVLEEVGKSDLVKKAHERHFVSDSVD